jgi:hypothetical protein
MKTNLLSLIILALFSTAAVSSTAEEETGFQPLFNGKDFTGWKLRRPDGNHSWSILPGGILKNTCRKRRSRTDLVTEKKFWNFTVRYEYMTPENSNSGFYLRGRHEIQILGDFKSGKPSLGGNGAIYNFKAPTSSSRNPVASGRRWKRRSSVTGLP